MTKIQICGVKTLEDALMCERVGADAVGFVHVEGRSRSISLDRIKEIGERLLPYTTKSLICFPDEANEAVERGRYVNADLLQLYTLDLEEIKEIKKKGFKVVRVVSVNMSEGELEFDIDEFNRYVEVSDMILFEPSLDGEKGGMGLGYDYKEILSPYTGRCGYYGIAGGLAPDNVDKALALDPYVVDVSSGVESIKGKKDENKVKRFIDKVRGYEYET